jgi:hypothetical protein
MFTMITFFLSVSHRDPMQKSKDRLWNQIYVPSGVTKSVLTLFSVEHTNVLDRAVVRNQLAGPPSMGRLTALDRRNAEKPRFAAPGGTPSGTVRLGLSWDRQATQNSLNRRGDEGGEQWRLEKLGFGENKVKLIMIIGW